MTHQQTEAPPPNPKQTQTRITWSNRWDHLLARIGYRRGRHRVEPGLYVLGEPEEKAPIFVTANYTLSFDALRQQLDGIDGYILVLDTKGVNVWCAAGKGTFSTAALVSAIRETRLADRVAHRRVIVPQLGAVGVAGWRVKKESGFRVDFGPVRAKDIPRYLTKGEVTAEMRQVKFSLRDRLVLTPVELTNYLIPTAIAAAALYLLAGPTAALAALTAVLAGVFLVPVLLPLLPTPNLSVKGFVLGLAVSTPFAFAAWVAAPGGMISRTAAALAYPLLMAPTVAFLSLNFTGSTTFTSQSGVRNEIARYTRPVVATAAAGLLALVLSVALRFTAGA
jgi:hypothetical protein